MLAGQPIPPLSSDPARLPASPVFTGNRVQLAKAAGKYAGRIADTTTHQRTVALRGAGHTIKQTAEQAGCSESQVKRIGAGHKANA
ncbi:MAG: helix-turn-helix domain-containing protein [Methylovulum sp.]|nr:helix-turn-helix domain-containing protein [Methylovulum sp.]